MVRHIVKPLAVHSDMPAIDPDAEPESLFKDFDKPLIVFVYGSASADDNFDKIEEVVFKNEKIGLGMKAFRTLKITPDDAERDGLIGTRGKTIPRLLVIDPIKEKVKVLEAKKIKVSALYTTMKGVAKSFYKDSLEKVVKSHLKILNERDKLYHELKTLKDKEGRLAEKDTAAARRELEKLSKECEELEKEIEEVAVRERELWQLRPRHEKEPVNG